jgi:Putative phage tail protein
MATLVLGSLGTALGGPLGGAVGSLLGQAVDTSLFASPPRQGPRLGDLSVQTSTYGTPIPQVFGSMRVAGTVIWATPLKESAQLVGGGKGQSGSVAYGYSVSLAVALSSRRSVGIKRIWADGKLLRGEAGDFKIRAKFRFYSGDGNQALDPLIAAIEGPLGTPAYRGSAMAVFEDLDLAPFGNRIPMLTFELVADALAPRLGDILTEASNGAVVSNDDRLVSGYAAYGASVRDGLSALIDSFGIALRDDGTRLTDGAASLQRQVPLDDLGCAEGADVNVRFKRWQQPAASLPGRISLSYHDHARDYQASQKQATGLSVGGRLQAVSLAAVLPAAKARLLCENMMARALGQRERMTVWLSPTFLKIQPGQLLTFEDSPTRWVVDAVVIERLVVKLDLKRAVRDLHEEIRADPGRQTSKIDVVPGATELTLLDLPSFDWPGSSTGCARVVLAASRSGPGWTQVPVEFSVAGAEQTGRTATARAVLGATLNVLGDANSCLIDTRNSLDVELVNDADWLQSCDDQALGARNNLMAVGDEIIQFGDATPIAERRFRLSRLLRGRGGTEWAASLHAIGEKVVLLEPAALIEIPAASYVTGAVLSARPMGLGDRLEDAAQTLTVQGQATRPPSPAHLRATSTDTALRIEWVRRSRSGWAWIDGIDAPLAEDNERYVVSVVGSQGAIEREVQTSSCSVPTDDVLALGPGSVGITVVQVGSNGLSTPSRIRFQGNMQ